MIGVLIVMAAVSVLLMRFGNSRQWLIAWLCLPVLAAGIAWTQDGFLLAIQYFIVGQLGFFLPWSEIFWWLFDFRKIEALKLRDMWHEPFNMMQRTLRKKSNAEQK